jgi:Fur family transcriptional regulator, peroxide stress response regulator
MMPAVDPEASHVGARVESFVARCRERGLSVTPQRLTLYRALVSTTAHPTPEMLFADVREEMPTLSLATVYKAIETFKDLGVVHEIRVPDDHRMRLDANMDPHHHLVCTRCQIVVDVHTPLGIIELPEAARQGFEVAGHAVQFHGICPDCQPQ